MSDYLRARIDALQNEMAKLQSKVDELSAKLEVSQMTNYPDNWTINSTNNLNSTKQ